MSTTQPVNNFQPHIDYNQMRPITIKDVNGLDPAVKGFIQTHSFGIDQKTNHFVF